jgi:hypothetical protein
MVLLSTTFPSKLGNSHSRKYSKIEKLIMSLKARFMKDFIFGKQCSSFFNRDLKDLNPP